MVTTAYILPLSDSRATLAVAGGKGTSLARLAAAGLPVPVGFHITTAAYQQFLVESGLQPRILAALEQADISQPATLEAVSQIIGDMFAREQMPPAIAGTVAQAYASLPGEDPAVAVRSSATAEDLPGLSFAGQQETYLNVRGIAAVLDAVQRCWASLWTARAIGYRIQHGIDQDAVRLAVVVQRLVPAEVAGILFTAHPLTGRRDQVVISAAWGLGEAVVGGLVTPDTLTIHKATGQVITRETGDKQVMTVRVDGGTEEHPVPEALRRAPALDDRQAAELARLGVQIEQLYEQAMDVEWTLADGEFAIVQARPITALPPEAASPLETAPPIAWEIPDPKVTYFRSSIIELMPDPLTPLFASLGRKAINAGTGQLFAEILGPGVVPDEICVTINDYAYYGMRLGPKLVWRLLVGIVSFWPKLRHSEQRWREGTHVRYVATLECWQARPLSERSAAELLEGPRQIVAEAVHTYNVLQSGILGLAMGNEALFTVLYDRLIKRRDDPPAQAFLLGFDSVPIVAEKALYDLAEWCRTRPGLADYIVRMPPPQLADQLGDALAPPGIAAGDWDQWQRRFHAHLEQYGHALYGLDFAKPVPADDPAPLLATCQMYLNGQGTDPHERQRTLAARRDEASQIMLGRLKGLRLKLFRKTLGWAQQYAPLREDSLADIGLGYPLLRRMLRELGRRLVQAGMIEQADDVYWLNESEATRAAAALDRGETPHSAMEIIRQRQAVWRAEQRVTPPPALPERTGWTKVMDQAGPARAGQETGDTIQGVGASPGRVTAQARVLHGPEDFGQMRPGEALVAAITTPAWTPLFAMASAVVTDIGGPLSHGSIVAREYGIPAVLGTGVATRRIRSGQSIAVDGSAGVVVLGQS
jgi:phosphohistidine swiveling domain-containing protein